MSREVKRLEEALEVLMKLNVMWLTVHRNYNSLCDIEIAFAGKDCLRIAYYDEKSKPLSIN
jgi:hypothetical protein